MKNLNRLLVAGVFGAILAVGTFATPAWSQEVPDVNRPAPVERRDAVEEERGFHWGWLGLLGLAGLAGLMNRGGDHRTYRDTDVNRTTPRP